MTEIGVANISDVVRVDIAMSGCGVQVGGSLTLTAILQQHQLDPSSADLTPNLTVETLVFTTGKSFWNLGGGKIISSRQTVNCAGVWFQAI